MRVPEEWFRDWFGTAYLSLYPHRDAAEAEAAVALLERELAPAAGERVLDLACGAGRHLPFLDAAGPRPVGLDLSWPLLREASGALPGAALVRGDMRRLPFARGAFDHLASFFTSFGYFSDPREDAAVAAEMRRVLRSGGGFILDYLNAPRVRDTLVPEDERVLEGRRVRQRRWLEDGAVVKRIEIEPDGEKAEVHHERVRLYEPDELEALLGRHGLGARRRFGDYDGRPHASDAPRLILVGRAT